MSNKGERISMQTIPTPHRIAHFSSQQRRAADVKYLLIGGKGCGKGHKLLHMVIIEGAPSHVIRCQQQTTLRGIPESQGKITDYPLKRLLSPTLRNVLKAISSCRTRVLAFTEKVPQRFR